MFKETKNLQVHIRIQKQMYFGNITKGMTKVRANTLNGRNEKEITEYVYVLC
jgi:hypothetical protein